jgi:hypothetical protein
MANQVILLSSVALLFLISAGLFVTTQQKIDPLQASSLQTAANQPSSMGERMSRMSFSDFDKETAKKLMDKDGDGKCDACGMPVEMCIDSGQMECNMDSKSTMGVLGSAHIHADWKIYLDGKPMDFSGKDHMTRMQEGLSVSSFIHVDSGAPEPEKTGNVLHMHATGVPLWIFFESIDMKLPENVKMYVNGKETQDYRNYVFNDLDKILITDGKGDLNQQLNSITNFAGKH